MLPFKIGDSGLLGNIFQLAPGFIALRLEPEGVALRLEPEGVALIVARGRIVVRLRGVVWKGWIRGWR
jgi:hypothetical protein